MRCNRAQSAASCPTGKRSLPDLSVRHGSSVGLDLGQRRVAFERFVGVAHCRLGVGRDVTCDERARGRERRLQRGGDAMAAWLGLAWSGPVWPELPARRRRSSTFSTKSLAPMASDSAKRDAARRAFSSSRTLPGQRCRPRSSSASGESVFGGSPRSDAMRARRWSLMRGRSPRRARSGGTSRVMPRSR